MVGVAGGLRGRRSRGRGVSRRVVLRRGRRIILLSSRDGSRVLAFLCLSLPITLVGASRFLLDSSEGRGMAVAHYLVLQTLREPLEVEIVQRSIVDAGTRRVLVEFQIVG